MVEDFSFQAGVTCRYPVKKLAEGIDFSNCINFGSNQPQPIQLWVKKTWWSGLNVKLTVLDGPDHAVLVFENKEIKYLEPGADLNLDDYALEMVTEERVPILQLIVAEDYKTIYLNVVLTNKAGIATVLKDRSLQRMSIAEAKKQEHRLDRMFKYPSYVHKGERE